MNENNYDTETDLKSRFAGILENPYVSKVHRNILDGFKVTGLAGVLKNIDFESILDVGCGYGEYQRVTNGKYVGLDNSFRRVHFAQHRYNGREFVHADATQLPFKDNTFEAVLLANTAHHLSDEELVEVLTHLCRVTQKYVIIDDCIKWRTQNRLSQYFYSLDRGTMFRTAEQFLEIFKRFPNLKLALKDSHMTFPGLYLHGVFVLELLK